MFSFLLQHGLVTVYVIAFAKFDTDKITLKEHQLVLTIAIF